MQNFVSQRNIAFLTFPNNYLINEYFYFVIS